MAPPAGVPGVLLSEKLAQSLHVLRRHWRVIVFVPALALVVSLIVSASAATVYSATSKIVISPYNPVTTLLSPGSTPTSSDPERDLNTAVSQITATPVAQMVRRTLGLGESTQALLDQVDTSIEGTTSIVDIVAKDRSATRAARIANAFATMYASYSLNSQRAVLHQALTRYQQKLAAMTPAQLAAPAGTQLESEIGTLQAATAGAVPDAQTTQVATVPTSPSRPRLAVDALIALVVGLVIAVIVVLLLELLDRTLRDDEDAAALARIPSLGVIPRNRPRLYATLGELRTGGRWRRRAGPAAPGVIRVAAGSESAGEAASSNGSNGSASHAVHPIDREQEEAYGSLAVSLLALSLGAPENVVMITSPGPRDGKTIVTIRLAAALADLGQRVTLVECDLRRPLLARYLGLRAPAEGVSTILSGSSSMASALIEVSSGTVRGTAPYPKDAAARERAKSRGQRESSFSVLPAGPVPARPLALLRSPELAPLLRELQEQADIVLVDSPPLGAIPDAVVLAECADQIVLVARVGHTRRDAVSRCRAFATKLGQTPVGIVTVGGSRDRTLDYYCRPDFDPTGRPVSQRRLLALAQPQASERPPRRPRQKVTPAADKGDPPRLRSRRP